MSEFATTGSGITSPTFSVSHVALTVNDLDRVANFYRDAIGLDVLDRDGTVARLGAGGATLLELRRDAQARRHSPHEAGLFHTAFLLPSRSALASWVRHAVERRVPITGASDHAVSEALYLADPEGNGIEIYADRPASTWVWQDGHVRMGTIRLNIPDLLRDAPETDWKAAPSATRVGHVHLRVGSIEDAEAFYAGTLGLAVTSRSPGGSFYAANGYHHHIATNVWNSSGAGPRTFPSTGLADVSFTGSHSGVEIDLTKDPWGTPLSFRG